MDVVNKMKLNKISYLIAISLLLASEKALSAETQQSPSTWPLFNPNAMPDSRGLWVDGELLFWQSNVGSLDYGVDSKSTTSVNHGHVHHPHFDWNAGFRLGLGAKLPHDKWDLFVNYTYMHGRAHGSFHESGRVIFPTWASGFNAADGTVVYADSAKAHWHLNLNMTDLELGRNCIVSQWLSIRPFAGIRGLIIDQTYHVQYLGGTVAPTDTDNVHLDTNFWGVGLRMGFNSLWGLGKGLGLYGNGSASLLSGHFDIDEKEKLKKAGTRLFSVDRDVNNVVVAADFALGIQWDYLFSKDRYHFGVKFGWEFNMFFDQNQLFNFLSSSNPGSVNFQNDDLSFQGVTLGLRFDF
jgi:hypothetical protein